MILLYRLLFLPALILVLPYYGLRMFRRGGYRHDFHHRFGLIDRPPPKRSGIKRIWIQAVSVGEIKAIEPLLYLLEKNKHVEIVLTTTTSTGYKIARDQYAHRILKTGIFPIDFYPFSRSAWRRIDPDLVILMEGELWPEHLRQAQARKIPAVLINARLSDRSFGRYRKVRFLAKRLLRKLDHVLASSHVDAHRFSELGLDEKKITVTGNLKFDVVIEPILSEREREVLREEMGLVSKFKETHAPMRPPLILLGSSTWPGEEELLLEVLEQALQDGVNLRLLLIPRHAERRGEIAEMLKKKTKRGWHFRSQGTKPTKPIRIYVGDTTGELAILSQVADVAFIGKSLSPNEGGQTPIEAGALGLPIVYGPNMDNFRALCLSLEQSGAAWKSRNADIVKLNLLELLNNFEQRKLMTKAAQQWHIKNQGATERTVQFLAKYID